MSSDNPYEASTDAVTEAPAAPGPVAADYPAVTDDASSTSICYKAYCDNDDSHGLWSGVQSDNEAAV
jgi:hypothetical protein